MITEIPAERLYVEEFINTQIAAIRQTVGEGLADLGVFQYLAVLHQDMVTGIREGKRQFGYQIEVRSWESSDAVIAEPSRLAWEKLLRIAKRITTEVPGVVSVTYNIAAKPPSTIEAV
ncbi:MAG: hypothetical protein ABIJ93_06715 [candidate division WOR-3 bacterium]